MYRIDDPTAATSLPTPEAAGTEGFFTEGNPATGTPATRVRGSWLNMLQEELRAIVVAAGLTPAKGSNAQVLAAIKALGCPAQFQLKTVGGNPNLFLVPFGGVSAFIPGIGVISIPAAGVQLAPTGLTANTTYYIYLTVASGTPTLINSTSKS